MWMCVKKTSLLNAGYEGDVVSITHISHVVSIAVSSLSWLMTRLTTPSFPRLHWLLVSDPWWHDFLWHDSCIIPWRVSSETRLTSRESLEHFRVVISKNPIFRENQRKFHVPGRGPDQLNRCEVAAESSLLTCSHLCSHIPWYNTIGFLLPCGCSWISFWENSHSQQFTEKEGKHWSSQLNYHTAILTV